MRRLSALVLATLFLVACGEGQNPPLAALDANGCGAKGLQGYLVPDSTLLSRCKFKAACDAHDICYGKCLEGGELFENQTCKDQAARALRKQSCDATFFSDIIKDNDEKSICAFYGKVYSAVVARYGEGNFKGKEINDQFIGAFSKGEAAQGQLLRELESFSPKNLQEAQSKLENISSELLQDQPNLDLEDESKLLQNISETAELRDSDVSER